MQRPRRTLHLDPPDRCSGVLVRQFFAQRTNRIGQIVHLGHRGPQSLHCVAALRDRLGRLIDGARKDLLRFGRTIRQKVERGLESQQQPVEALQQGVVQVACNARALGDTRVQCHLELTMQPPDAKLVTRPRQKQEQHGAQGEEPSGLVIRRSDGEIQLGGAFTPDAVTIGCDHAEGILPWRQFRVESLPARTGVGPVIIVAVEPVTELHSLRNRERRRRVINLQVTRVRVKFVVVDCRQLLAINDDRFDVCLRRERPLRDPGRVHHLHDEPGRKPHPPIRRHIC